MPWHVLERVHGQVGPALFERDFELLDKQALAAHLAQGAVQNLVALGGHAQQGDLMPALLQQGLDMLGLPHRQAALSCCYRQIAHVQWFKAVTCW